MLFSADEAHFTHLFLLSNPIKTNTAKDWQQLNGVFRQIDSEACFSLASFKWDYRPF